MPEQRELPKQKHWICAPDLACTERSGNRLVFSRFGNPEIYHTKNVDIALGILREARQARSEAELFQRLEARSRDQLLRAREELESLERAKLLRETLAPGSSAGPARPAEGHVLQSLVPDESFRGLLESRIASRKIGIFDFLNLSAELERALLSRGFSTIRFFDLGNWQDERALAEFCKEQDFLIVLGTDRHCLAFSRLNQAFVAQERRWLHVVLDPHGGMLGPVFGLSGGPCYDCLLEQRNPASDPLPVDLIDTGGDLTLDYSGQVIPKQLLDFAATEAMKIVTHLLRPESYDGAYRFDFLNFRMEFSPLGPSPYCETCRAQRCSAT